MEVVDHYNLAKVRIAFHILVCFFRLAHFKDLVNHRSQARLALTLFLEVRDNFFLKSVDEVVLKLYVRFLSTVA